MKNSDTDWWYKDRWYIILMIIVVALFLSSIYFFGPAGICIIFPIMMVFLLGVLAFLLPFIESVENKRRESELWEEEEWRVMEWREEEERRESEWKKEKERLEIEISKLEKPYIKFFVEKYGRGDTEKKDELLDLLEDKGLEMETSHLYYFIKREIGRKEEEDFIRKVSYGNPKTIEGYCSNFLNCFGDRHRNEDLLRLERLLIDKGLYSELEGLEKLGIKIREMQNEKRIKMFEKNLLEKGGEYFDIKRIDTMGGFEFEGFVARLYKSMGYDVTTTPLTGDQGADLVIEKFGEKTAVQIKRSSTNIGNKAIQEIVAARNFYKCDKAIVITNSFFTRSAMELAGSNNVKLVSRTELEELVQKYL